MRAEQWFMIAIGTLGAFAVYKLVTSKSSTPKPEDTPLSSAPGQPDLQLPPLSLLQNIVGKDAPGTALVSKGTPYRGRIELPVTRPPMLPMRPPPGGFSPLTTLVASAPREQIAAELQRLGFDDITVYMNFAEAQQEDAIPLPDALANPTPGSRWFAATWRGQNAQTLPRQHVLVPRELVLLWLTAFLPGPRSFAGPQTGFFIPYAAPHAQHFAG